MTVFWADLAPAFQGYGSIFGGRNLMGNNKPMQEYREQGRIRRGVAGRMAPIGMTSPPSKSLFQRHRSTLTRHEVARPFAGWIAAGMA
jgi:hypothetical protein